jgi:hypothetical protein
MPPLFSSRPAPRYRFIVVAALASAGAITRSAHAQVTWSVQTADGASGSGWTTSLRLNGAGLPRVAEWGAGIGVRYAAFDGSSWTVETVPPPSAPAAAARADATAPGRALLLVTTATALALDAGGDPWIVYAVTDQFSINPPPIPVRVAHRAGGTWTTESIEGGLGYPSVEIDASSRLHLCFDSGTPTGHVLRYAVRDGGVWSYETVDAHGAGGVLRLDGAGVPHVLYWDGARGALVLAERVGPATWDTTTVPVVGETGSHAFALASDGTARVAIASPSSTPVGERVLRYYEQQSDGSWTDEIADGTSTLKVEPSIALDPMGNPVIAYNDQGALDLKVAIRVGGLWSNAIVDGEGNTGYYASLAVDALARPVVTYQKGDGSGNMRAAFGTATAGVRGVGTPTTFRLVHLGPNPARVGGPLAFALDLPAAAAVRLDVFDAAGRRLATRPAEAMPAGHASLTWDPGLASPGLVFVRASAPGWQTSARIAVVR